LGVVDIDIDGYDPQLISYHISIMHGAELGSVENQVSGGSVMIDYAGLNAVFAVLEEGSFEWAASHLRVTPSAISHRVKSIEERLGAVLVVRGASCVATPAGRRMYRHVERVHLLEADLQQSFPGLLSRAGNRRPAKARIVLNADSLSTWCMEAFANFSSRTGCLLDLAVEDQDFALDWLVNGETDAAVTATEAPAVDRFVDRLFGTKNDSQGAPKAKLDG
jgi:LysR family transcriptional regulator, chromosome initiation inhibitor